MIFPDVVCDCDEIGSCGPEEHPLRMIAANRWPHGAMTVEQRAWCIQEADSAGEGSYDPKEMESYSDQDLARAVLQAWWDYVRSNCL